MFRIELAGRAARLEDVFEGFGEHDRLGLVMRRPCGAVGASALIAAAITAFYDIQRSRATDFFIYPDYYLFHVGGPLGDHARLDVWPSRKEVVVEDDPARILEAIDDRAISRLLVEDGPRGDAELDAEAVASARARVSTCLAYSASGRVGEGDVRIASNEVVEGYVTAVLDPDARMERLRSQGKAGAQRADAIAVRAGEVPAEVRREIMSARTGLIEDGLPVETYRRIGLDEALALLG
jgi:hypothetical protein